MKFQTMLKTCVWHSLDNVKCKNTVDDDFTFTKEEIFMGCYPNDFDEMACESGSECEEIITFPGKIFRKSCFTHSKLDFERFCSVCQKKKKIREDFECDLFVFSRIENLDTKIRQ